MLCGRIKSNRQFSVRKFLLGTQEEVFFFPQLSQKRKNIPWKILEYPSIAKQYLEEPDLALNLDLPLKLACFEQEVGSHDP